MEITVKLYGVLRRHRPATAPGSPHHPFSVQIADDATIADLIQQLALPEAFVNATAVNGESAPPDTPLPANAQVSIFPPSAGG
jgi:molybdopterin converting factor small subunit